MIREAVEIFHRALAEMNPGRAVRNAIERNGDVLRIADESFDLSLTGRFIRSHSVKRLPECLRRLMRFSLIASRKE